MMKWEKEAVRFAGNMIFTYGKSIEYTIEVIKSVYDITHEKALDIIIKSNIGK